MKKKILCFDLDNTISNTRDNNYSKSRPKKEVIKLINSLYDEGYFIKILTARYMGRTKDDFLKANKIGYKKTNNQLKSWGLKFHKLFITKPSFDVYVDDKNFEFEKGWVTRFKKKFLKSKK